MKQETDQVASAIGLPRISAVSLIKALRRLGGDGWRRQHQFGQMTAHRHYPRRQVAQDRVPAKD